MVTYYRLKKQQEKLTQERDELLQKNKELREEIKRLQHDKKYLEEVAREQFNMKKPGEEVYIITPK